MLKKRGQVATFVIVALVIVGGILVYFVTRESVEVENVPAELVPVFSFYQSCIEQEVGAAVELAGTQGGYVEVPNYIPGSEFAPFSSHLNFLGFPVPYWYYVSGNGLIKEQVPSRNDIEIGIENYVAGNLKKCDFESFYRQGFLIDVEEPSVSVSLKDRKVEVNVRADMTVSKGEDSGRKVSHNVEVNSKLGKFYNIGRRIYDKQKEEAFLEDYAIDVLRLYAPVDGVEIQCGPKIWTTNKVIGDIRQGLEENFMTLKFDGSYSNSEGEDSKYFVLDENVDERVNVLYSRNWPTKIEISGDGVDDEIITSEAIGTQEGLGIMGFCYVPYHFVYDVSFPTMIQVYDGDELFQFPVVVIIDKNVPREAVLPAVPLGEEEDFDLCEFKTQEVEVNLFDVNLNKVDANISYECFNQRCRLGETRGGRIVTVAPACVNGNLHVRAEGFAEKKQSFSTNKERSANIVLEREHEVNVNVSVGGKDSGGTTIVSFVRSDGKAVTAALPEVNNIKLTEGDYEVKVYVYGDSEVVIPASTKTQCVDVPKEGLLAGLFGAKEEKCFSIEVPETKIEFALIGGGKLKTYLLESELERGGLVLSVDKLPTPSSVDQLQQNFELFESKRISMEFYDV